MHEELPLEALLKAMNQHLPAKRPSLLELMGQEDPNYIGRDGVRYVIKRPELDTIASILPSYELGRLKIPIYIASDTSYPGGAWKIRGRLEVQVVSSIVGREPEKEDEMLIFFPHLSRLRDVLPTTTTVFYMP